MTSPRWGRKNAFLITNGLLFAAYGYSLDVVVNMPERQAAYSMVTKNLGLPISVWAYIWGVTGAIVMFSGLTNKLKPFAFAGLMGLNLIWTLNFLLVEFFYEVPQRTWIGGLLFGALTVSIGIVAGWPEVRVRK